MKIKAFHANTPLKGTYKGTYGVNLFNMERLVFSPVKRYTSGNKKGRYYTQATIPQAHRHLYNGSKQISRSLGSYASEAERKRDLTIQEENRRFQKKLSDYDPLVGSAENLIEALFATYDLNGTIRPEKYWLNQKITKKVGSGIEKL